MLVRILIVLAAVLIGLFLKNDADLSLIFMPKVPENSYKGKVVWITGASSGIGASLAEDLTKLGANVIISARRTDKLEEVASKCSKFGESPDVLPLDVTIPDEQQKAFDFIMNKYGRIDSLVLNAGISQRNTANDTPYSVTKNMFEVNFFSFVSLTKIVLPTLLKQQSGQV